MEVTKYEELEEVHAELKLKQLLWNSIQDWDQMVADVMEVMIDIKAWNIWPCTWPMRTLKAKFNSVAELPIMTSY